MALEKIPLIDERTYRRTYTHAFGTKYDDTFPSVKPQIGTLTIIRNDRPDWRSIIRKGGDASNAYTRSFYKVLRQPKAGFTYDAWPVYDLSWNGWNPSFDTVNPIDSSDVPTLDRAIGKFRSKLQAETGDFAVLAPIAELKDLHSTIRSSVDLTTRFVRGMLGRGRGAGGLAFAAEAWLTWNFGINPLINDTKNTLDAIDAFMKRKNHTRVIRASATKEWKSRTDGGYPLGFLAEQVRGGYPSQTDHKLRYSLVGGYNFLLASGNNYGISDHFHISWGEAVPALWELFPWSWLWDYFFTIGDYLEDTFTVTPGNMIYLNQSKLYKQTTTISQRVSTRVTSSYCEPMVYEAGTFTRTPLAKLPARHLRIRVADEIGKNALKKLLNLLSIAILRHR